MMTKLATISRCVSINCEVNKISNKTSKTNNKTIRSVSKIRQSHSRTLPNN